MENRPRYRVPDELRETLLDFTIAYLLERPANLAEFGLNFFTRLRNERESGASSSGGSNQNSGALNGGSTDANDEGRTQIRSQGGHGTGRPAYPGPPAGISQGVDPVEVTRVADAAVKKGLNDAQAKIRDGNPK